MKVNMTKIIFGAVAVLLGVLMLLSAFDLFEFENIYPYWTLFIIIPTVVSMITNGFTLWKTALLAFGVNALICQQHWGEWGWKQFVIVNIAVCFILFGVYLLLGDLRKKKPNNVNTYNYAPVNQGYTYANEDAARQDESYAYTQGQPAGNANAGYAGSAAYGASSGPCDYNIHPSYTGILCSNKYKNCSKDFRGGSVVAVLGGVQADFSEVFISGDVTVNVTSVFGTVDIYVPNNVRVEANGTEILGSCDNFVVSSFGPEVPCLRIKYVTVFGNIDIKIR